MMRVGSIASRRSRKVALKGLSNALLHEQIFPPTQPELLGEQSGRRLPLCVAVHAAKAAGEDAPDGWVERVRVDVQKSNRVYLTLQEAADLAGVSKKRMQNLIGEGVLR